MLLDIPVKSLNLSDEYKMISVLFTLAYSLAVLLILFNLIAKANLLRLSELRPVEILGDVQTFHVKLSQIME